MTNSISPPEGQDKTLFTPGPWEYTATVSFHDRPDLPCVVDQHRLVVAQCWDDGHSEEECEANARLIAAAPALYEALEKIDAKFNAQAATTWGLDADDCEIQDIVRSALNQVRAIL